MSLTRHSLSQAHTIVNRALCILPGVGFVSGSHDTSVRVWALSGETLAELYGHTALVYTVAATASGLIVSGGSTEKFTVYRKFTVHGSQSTVLQPAQPRSLHSAACADGHGLVHYICITRAHTQL